MGGPELPSRSSQGTAIPSESRGIAFQNPARGRQRRGSQAEESRLAQGPSLTREASTDTAGPVGRPLAICPLESLVSAQDGAADRVGKKGFAEKGLFYCNYLERVPRGWGKGAPLLTRNICGAGDLLGKKAKT